MGLRASSNPLPRRVVDVDENKIPLELRLLVQWVVWRYRTRDKKPTKVPFRSLDPVTEASTTVSYTWSTYEEAVAAANSPANKLDGIGFVFTAEDPYCGIDFDNCYDASGNLQAWALHPMGCLTSYAEKSPSGKGLKLFLKASVPDGKGRKKSGLGADKTGAIEVYDRGRFFTVTGNAINSVREIADHSASLLRLHAQWFPPKEAEERPRLLPVGQLDLRDADILALAKRSKGGDRFALLFDRGDWKAAGYASESEADLALCSDLAFYTRGDKAAIDRIFRGSGLCDGKWLEREDYRQSTIDKACQRETFYDPDHGKVSGPSHPARGKHDGSGEDGKGVGGKGPADQPGVDGTPERPKILITTDEWGTNNEALVALATDPDVYQRSGQLATVHFDAPKTKEIDRPEGSPRIVPIRKPVVRELLTKNADWYKWRQKDGKKDEWEEVPAHPPDWCYSALFDRGQWEGVRHLEGVIESPSLMADGTILDRPGYDSRTGLVYRPNADFPPIPTEITQADARAAAMAILSVVDDFPFADIQDDAGERDDGGIGHRAAWLAGLLTPLARYAIKGPCPLFLIDANTAGSGKSKLCDIVSIIATGRDAARLTYPDSDEEMRKQILSIAVSGDRLILIDNVSTGSSLGGAAIDAALTATVYKGRILGRTEMVEVPIYTVWYATGNNLGLRGDALRRVVPCRLSSKEERPEERTGFQIEGDILEYVRCVRPQLVVHALVILRGFVLAGLPQADLTPMDYPAWSRIVRQSIRWALGVDPCGTRHEMVADDPETALYRGLLAGWAELPLTGDATTTEVLTVLRAPEHKEKFGTIREVLSEWTKDGDLPSPASLGMRLKKIRGRVIGGRMLNSIRSGPRQYWRLEVVGETEEDRTNRTNGTDSPPY